MTLALGQDVRTLPVWHCSSLLYPCCSSVLPLPFAFSRTGVTLGCATALLVALANAYTGTVLLRAAGHAGCYSFEGLAAMLGGPTWRRGTQVALVLLLFGTLCGDLALLSDLGVMALEGVGGRVAVPAWLMAGQGRVIMALVTLCVVMPLSMLRNFRQLEGAASAGVTLVAGLVGVLVVVSVRAGMPAYASGAVPVWRVRWTTDLPEAIAVLSFAFYVHPMLLPLLGEMPRDTRGVRIAVAANQVVTLGVALLIYTLVGVFGAARFGLDTASDVLVNPWLPPGAQAALCTAMVFYLALSAAPIAITLRFQLDSLVAGDGAPRLPRRTALLAVLSMACALAVALTFPSAAEKIFAGQCLGFCLCCMWLGGL